MRALYLVLSLTVLGTAAAFAAGSIEFTANSEADVWMDGKYVGRTPGTLEGVSGGFHWVEFRSLDTGETRGWRTYMQKGMIREKEIHASFGGEPTAAEATLAEAPRTKITEDIGADADLDRLGGESEEKEEVRDTSLGVAGTGALIGAAPLVGLGLGAAIVNEEANE